MLASATGPRIGITGLGVHVPERVVTNDDLAQIVETSDEWIRQRTGITQRHIAADGEFTSHLALKASERALAHAGVKVADLDLIVLATATPNETFPATATVVQKELGMTKGAAFDLQAVCAGFVYALSTADSLIKNGLAGTALVIGAETFSRILDWNDRGTCVLFGDGAGAVILRGEPGQGTSADRGILANALHSDGRQHDILYVDGGPSSTRTTGYLRMEGKEVFKHAVVNMAAVVGEVLGKAGLTAADIDWLDLEREPRVWRVGLLLDAGWGDPLQDEVRQAVCLDVDGQWLGEAPGHVQKLVEGDQILIILREVVGDDQLTSVVPDVGLRAEPLGEGALERDARVLLGRREPMAAMGDHDHGSTVLECA